MVRLVYKGISRIFIVTFCISPVLSSGLGSERGLFRRFFIKTRESNVGMAKACLRGREGLL